MIDKATLEIMTGAYMFDNGTSYLAEMSADLMNIAHRDYQSIHTRLKELSEYPADSENTDLIFVDNTLLDIVSTAAQLNNAIAYRVSDYNKQRGIFISKQLKARRVILDSLTDEVIKKQDSA